MKRGYDAAPVIHEQQIGVERGGKRNSLCFTGAELLYRGLGEVQCLVHVHPRGRIGNPVAHRKWCVRIGQLVFHSGWQDYFCKQRGKDFDMPDQDQIINRAGVGDDEPHRLQAKLLKAIDLTTKILNGVFNPNVMGLQKSVELIAGAKPEEASQFILGEMTALVFLQRQCLQRLA